jgi:hypothetical protein
MNEMKPTACILMYSGMRNPEKELTEEEITTLRELVSKLEVPYPGQAHSHLGFSGYAATLDNIHVIASLWGHVRVFNSEGLPTAYSDTTGVLAYLCKIMTPVMIKHNEDAAKAMKDWEASLFPYNPPPWEPQ